MDRRLTILACLYALGAAPLHGQSLRGRVVDAPSRSGLADVHVLIEDLSGVSVRTAMTDSAGFFVVDLPTAGSFVVRAARFGFDEARVTVQVRKEAGTTMPALVMTPNIVALDSLEAIVSGGGKVGFSRNSHRRSGARMAALEQRGAWVESALREMPGLRLRQQGAGGMCIESTRAMMSMRVGMGRRNPSSCSMIVVVLDGMPLYEPWAWLQSMPISSLESIEYLTPSDAGFRYGLEASSRGALVLWSRGKGPYVDPLRNARHP